MKKEEDEILGHILPPLPILFNKNTENNLQKQIESVFISFEEAVKGVTLQGWEDEWISSASFNKSWAPLQEPKIDFIWSCAYSVIITSNHDRAPRGTVTNNLARGKWL